MTIKQVFSEGVDTPQNLSDVLLYAMGCCSSKPVPEWDMTFEPTELSFNKADSNWEEVTGDKATFGMGPPAKACARFGIMPAVIRCKVGFAGGTTDKPTFEDPGDYVQAIQIEFDSDKTDFKELLDVFWNEHDYVDPYTTPGLESVIFYHDDFQQTTAEFAKEEKEEEHDTIATKIVPFTTWVDAKPEFQHEILQHNQNAMKILKNNLRPHQMAHSHLAARLEGYLEGHGTHKQFEEEEPDLFIPIELADLIRQYLRTEPEHHVVQEYEPQEDNASLAQDEPQEDDASVAQEQASRFPLSADIVDNQNSKKGGTDKNSKKGGSDKKSKNRGIDKVLQSPSNVGVNESSQTSPNPKKNEASQALPPPNYNLYNKNEASQFPLNHSLDNEPKHNHHSDSYQNHYQDPLNPRLSTVPFRKPSAPFGHPPHSQDWRDASYDRSFYPSPPSPYSQPPPAIAPMFVPWPAPPSPWVVSPAMCAPPPSYYPWPAPPPPPNYQPWPQQYQPQQPPHPPESWPRNSPDNSEICKENEKPKFNVKLSLNMPPRPLPLPSSSLNPHPSSS